MNTFDLDLFIKSFEKAGVTVEKTGVGGVYVGGSITSGKKELEAFFSGDSSGSNSTIRIDGKTAESRMEFSTETAALLAA